MEFIGQKISVSKYDIFILKGPIYIHSLNIFPSMLYFILDIYSELGMKNTY